MAPPQRARLTRSREDRVIAGVAGGIGRHLGIDPVIVRVVFVVLVVAGGGGLLAYLIAWIVIPEEPVGGTPAPTRAATSGSTLFGLVLVVLGGMLLAQQFTSVFAWRYLGPALLIGLGVVLLARKGATR